MQPTVEAILHTPEGDAPLELRSSRVATFRATVRSGQILQTGDVVGELLSLNRRCRLVVPQLDQPLRVVEVLQDRGFVPVAYGAPLLQLALAAVGEGEAAVRRSEAEALGLPEDAVAFRAPTDGQFYRRPSPEDPPFVSEGDVLKAGQTVGLIEVMKFFYEVNFELAGFEGGAKVLKVMVEDAVAIESGEVVMYVGPA